MFGKKPINVVHTHRIEIPDIEEKVRPVINEVKQLAKTAGIVLLIGIPSTILLAALARVGADALIENMHTPIE